MSSQREGQGGTGPLYEHTPAGDEAAREDVVIPGSETGDQDESDNDVMTDDDLPSGG